MRAKLDVPHAQFFALCPESLDDHEDRRFSTEEVDDCYEKTWLE